MSVQFSLILTTSRRGDRKSFQVDSLDLTPLGNRASPVFVLDDFRVRGQPFAPHPHAGFSAVTYVFQDSAGRLRSRDSLGNDIVVGPGGIVWSEAGRGMMHEELPAELSLELHGLQFFVNLHASNKLKTPAVHSLDGPDVPEWTNGSGDRVRVVVGTFEDVSSPLAPVEPFTLLDVELKRDIAFSLASAHNAFLYVFSGEVLIRSDRREQRVAHGHGLALAGDGSTLTFHAWRPSQFLLLSGADIQEPTVVNGPFVMNTTEQVRDAIERYRRGEMGELAPYESA